MKLTTRRHFALGRYRNTAKIYLRKTFSNIFVTLTDLKNRVIVCKTSGNSGILRSKRRKKAPYAIESIVDELNTYLKLYKIQKVYLVLKMRINTYFYFLTRELAFHDIKVIGLRIRRPVAFNGVRGRKLRRI